MNRRARKLALITSGVGSILLGTAAESSSWMNPFLSHFPPALAAAGHLGGWTLVGCGLWMVSLGIRKHSRLWYLGTTICIGEALFVALSPWGAAFQLGLAGLTLGIALIVLGCVQSSDTHLLAKLKPIT